jgi:hypothetical protein
LDWGRVAGGAVHPEVASEPPLVLERAPIGIERMRATGEQHVSTAFPVPAMAEGAASGSATGGNLDCGGVVSGELHLDESSAKYQSEHSESDSELLLEEAGWRRRKRGMETRTSLRVRARAASGGGCRSALLRPYARAEGRVGALPRVYLDTGTGTPPHIRAYGHDVLLTPQLLLRSLPKTDLESGL